MEGSVSFYSSCEGPSYRLRAYAMCWERTPSTIREHLGICGLLRDLIGGGGMGKVKSGLDLVTDPSDGDDDDDDDEAGGVST